MKNMPFSIAGTLIVAMLFLVTMIKDWDEIVADNSPFAVAVGILVPVAAIIACMFYLKSGKK